MPRTPTLVRPPLKHSQYQHGKYGEGYDPLVELASCHFGAAEATADKNLDALCTYAHCRSNCHLNGSSVRNTSLNLTSDVVSNDIGINLRAFNLKDIDLYLFVQTFFNSSFNLSTSTTAFSDNNARTCGGW